MRDKNFERCRELFVQREIIVFDSVSATIESDDHIAKLKGLDGVIRVIMDIGWDRKLALGRMSTLLRDCFCVKMELE